MKIKFKTALCMALIVYLAIPTSSASSAFDNDQTSKSSHQATSTVSEVESLRAQMTALTNENNRLRAELDQETNKVASFFFFFRDLDVDIERAEITRSTNVINHIEGIKQDATPATITLSNGTIMNVANEQPQRLLDILEGYNETDKHALITSLTNGTAWGADVEEDLRTRLFLREFIHG